MTSTNCEKETEFLQAYLPSVKAGKYNINVNQSVTLENLCQSFKMGKTFIVGGPRFSLSPSDIHSVFPPSNHRGNFEDCLPHIVLTRATLPWERMMGSSDKTPWMALLLFDENDNIKYQNLKVRELLIDENFIGRNVYLEGNEIIEPISENETCAVIDIPFELFNMLVPTKNELEILAHARKVDTKDKDDSSPDNDGWFSVVVGNRLPASGDEGTKNTVHLVSLEGFCDYLPDDNGPKITSGTVRLISLASWSFFSISEKHHFGDLGKKLSVGTFGDIKDATKTWNNFGYACFRHITRLGKSIISWYRGPFIPYKSSADLDSPHSCADAALRYDPGSKAFDVSYAAAWQLGRLLALQNRSFAVAIFNWRRKKLQLERIGSNKDIFRKKSSMSGIKGQSASDGHLAQRSIGKELEDHIINFMENRP